MFVFLNKSKPSKTIIFLKLEKEIGWVPSKKYDTI